MISFDNKKLFYNNNKRHPFYNDATAIKKSGTDLCHRISYYTIATGICNALNFMVYHKRNGSCDETVLTQAQGYIAGMVLSVWGVMSDPGIMNPSELDCLNNIIALALQNQCYVPVCDLLADYFNAKDGDEYLSTIEECSNDLLGVLNSDNANLRPGNPNWNRSVSSAYDPDVAAYNSDENCFVLTEEDSIRITNLIEFTLGEAAGVPNTKNALFFYSAYGEDNLPILYSSQNEFGLRTSRYTVCNETIVYYNYVKKEPLSIDYDELQQMTELEIINSHIANSSAT